MHFTSRTFRTVVVIAGVNILMTVGQAANAAVISVNFTGGANSSVGANTAGVVEVGNWNDLSGTNVAVALIDDSAAATGVTLTSNLSNGGGAAGTFTNPGNNAMMLGNAFTGGFAAADIVLGGTIPYQQYDLYVYFNGAVSGSAPTHNYQVISGPTLNAYDTNTSDSSFILSNGTASPANGNYVVFTGLTASSFTLRSQGVSQQYGYFNGFQIVDTFVAPVPEPTTFVLLGLGALGVVASGRRRNRERSAS